MILRGCLEFHEDSAGILRRFYGDAGVMKGYMVPSNAGCQSKNAESNQVDSSPHKCLHIPN